MTSLRKTIRITAAWISEYAGSIHSPVTTVNGRLVAPATMPVIFWKSLDIPWLRNAGPLILGSQAFSYEAPILEGMTLDVKLSLMKTEKKAGSQRTLTLYTHTLSCAYRDRIIVTAETVLIKTGRQHDDHSH